MVTQLIRDKLDEYFNIEDKNEEKLFTELTLLVYSLNCINSNLCEIAKILPKKYINDLINYLPNSTIKLPTKEKYLESEFIAICYYLKVIKGYSWVDIKKFLDLPEKEKSLLSSISIGNKINKLHGIISKQLLKKLKDIESGTLFFENIIKENNG